MVLIKKLQAMGGSAYFLITPTDVIQFDLEVGEFYEVKIYGIGTLDKQLKTYGTTKIFSITKADFERFPKLEKGKFYHIIFKGLQASKNSNNIQKFKELIKVKEDLNKVVNSLVNEVKNGETKV